MSAWNMKCLICGKSAYDLRMHKFEFSTMGNDLVLMQEHVMSAHGYTSTQLYAQTRETLGPDHYRYSMPDGVAWLEAWKVEMRSTAVRSWGRFRDWKARYFTSLPSVASMKTSSIG
jgi:hypothetical protein